MQRLYSPIVDTRLSPIQLRREHHLLHESAHILLEYKLLSARVRCISHMRSNVTDSPRPPPMWSSLCVGFAVEGQIWIFERRLSEWLVGSFLVSVSAPSVKYSRREITCSK